MSLMPVAFVAGLLMGVGTFRYLQTGNGSSVFLLVLGAVTVSAAYFSKLFLG